MEKYIENENLILLSQEELIESEGGFIVIGVVFAGLALGLSAAYAVGYAVGSLTE